MAKINVRGSKIAQIRLPRKKGIRVSPQAYVCHFGVINHGATHRHQRIGIQSSLRSTLLPATPTCRVEENQIYQELVKFALFKGWAHEAEVRFSYLVGAP
jgi:hypothetical protein